MTDCINTATTATSSPTSELSSSLSRSLSSSPLYMAKVGGNGKTLSPSISPLIRDSDRLSLSNGSFTNLPSLCPRLLSPPLKSMRQRSFSESAIGSAPGAIPPPIMAATTTEDNNNNNIGAMQLNHSTVIGMLSEAKIISLEDQKISQLTNYRSADTLVAHNIKVTLNNINSNSVMPSPFRPRSKSVSGASGHHTASEHLIHRQSSFNLPLISSLSLSHYPSSASPPLVVLEPIHEDHHD